MTHTFEITCDARRTKKKKRDFKRPPKAGTSAGVSSETVITYDYVCSRRKHIDIQKSVSVTRLAGDTEGRKKSDEKMQIQESATVLWERPICSLFKYLEVRRYSVALML